MNDAYIRHSAAIGLIDDTLETCRHLGRKV